MQPVLPQNEIRFAAKCNLFCRKMEIKQPLYLLKNNKPHKKTPNS